MNKLRVNKLRSIVYMHIIESFVGFRNLEGSTEVTEDAEFQRLTCTVQCNLTFAIFRNDQRGYKKLLRILDLFISFLVGNYWLIKLCPVNNEPKKSRIFLIAFIG